MIEYPKKVTEKKVDKKTISKDKYSSKGETYLDVVSSIKPGTKIISDTSSFWRLFGRN